MFVRRFFKAVTLITLCGIGIKAFSHGWIETPPSRKQHCGVEVTPDNPSSDKCDDAFSKFTGPNEHWYGFMSVFALNGGRKVVKTTTNVCGFDGGFHGPAAGPWDTAAAWPVTPFSSGEQTFTWNIQYGPHFSDTEEMVLWITKPGFTFNADAALQWDQLEADPFCDEQIIPGDFSSNPKMSANQGANTISVTCDVPERSGRHIIYGEWGRSQGGSLERFFGCVDVDFGGGPPPTTIPSVPPTLTPSVIPSITPTVTPTIAPSPSPGGVSTSLNINNDFTNGYCAALTVTNNGDSSVTWAIDIEIEGTVYDFWNGIYSQEGSTLSVSGVDFNGTLQPGQSDSSIGFCANR